jgi:hypothetical protein
MLWMPLNASLEWTGKRRINRPRVGNGDGEPFGDGVRRVGLRRNTAHFVGQTIASRGLSRPGPGRRHKLIVCPTILPCK